MFEYMYLCIKTTLSKKCSYIIYQICFKKMKDKMKHFFKSCDYHACENVIFQRAVLDLLGDRKQTALK